MNTAGCFVHKLNREEFIALLKSRYTEDGCSVKAYKYLCEHMNKEKGFVRKFSGEDYYIHPQAVAEILIELVDAGDECVSVALLHDCIEDMEGDVEGELRLLFGDKITEKILLVTKKSDVDYHVPENLQNYLLGTLEDEDAVLVKIADRMNNNSTLSGASWEKKIKKTDETVMYFVPLALEAVKKFPHNSAFYGEAAEFFWRQID